MSNIFAINTSHGILSLKSGYIRIAVGGYASIFADDKDHPDFRDAYSKGWLKYSETEPEAGSVPAVKAIEFVQPNQGLTAEQLKAEQAKEQAPAPVAKTEALGQSDLSTGEAVVTKLGETESAPEVTEEDAPADAKKAGKKAAK